MIIRVCIPTSKLLVYIYQQESCTLLKKGLMLVSQIFFTANYHHMNGWDTEYIDYKSDYKDIKNKKNNLLNI